MRTMTGMARQPLMKRKQVRTNARARAALRRVVAEMAGRDGLAFEAKTLTQEALVCASWLWMEAMDPDALEAALAPHVRRLESIVMGQGDPATPPSVDAEGQGVADVFSPPTGARLEMDPPNLAG